METRVRVFLLSSLCALGLSGCGLFGGAKETPLGAEDVEEPTSDVRPESAAGPEASEQPVIDPQIARRKVKTPRIDGQDFQVTAYGGVLSIEDFGTSTLFGARFDYHITESLFLEHSIGFSKGATTSYERLSGGPQLLTDDDREYRFFNINIGWNALPGEVFIGENLAFNSAFYFTVGIGGTEFAGDNRFTANAGMGYRVLVTRFVAVNFDFRDHFFDIDLLGEKKVAHNLEGSLGLSFFF